MEIMHALNSWEAEASQVTLEAARDGFCVNGN